MTQRHSVNYFIHHYLFDSIVSTVLTLLAFQKVFQWCNSNAYSMLLTVIIAVCVSLVVGILYWYVLRRIYIKTMLSLYKTFDRSVIRHIERKGVQRWRSRYEQATEKNYNELPESRKKKVLDFALDMYRAEKLRESEMKAEAEKKLKQVIDYSKQSLLILGFEAEDIYKICHLVEFFVTTRSVIQSPVSISKRNDVSIADLKNFVANIAEAYDIDNLTAARFMAEVFKEWCLWVDTKGKVQHTEVSTIAKTLRTTKGKLRILPESILRKSC